MKGSNVYKVGCSKGADVTCEITCWRDSPDEIALKDQELHLWRFSLDCSEPEVSRLKNLLAPDEIVRANRLLDLRKTKQFIVARAYLRQILGNYQKITSRQIKFQYNNYGKPALAESIHPVLSFNLSHAGDWGVLAVAKSLAVGIDIEKIESELNYVQLADRYFDEHEKQQLAQYPSERQRRGFYRLWIQKEARLKLEGSGFQVRPVSSEDGKKEWPIRMFPIAPDFICCVATQKINKSIHRFHFPEFDHSSQLVH